MLRTRAAQATQAAVTFDQDDVITVLTLIGKAANEESFILRPA